MANILLILFIIFCIIITIIERYFILEEFKLTFKIDYDKGNFFYKCLSIRNKIKSFFKTFFN